MKISYNWLREYLPKLPKPEKLADLLTRHSLEVKAIEKLARDYILDIDVLPNRGHDCLSYLGIAKECAALLGLKIGQRKYKLEEDKKLKTSDFIKIEVQDKEACPRYTARVIDNIKIGPSPKWLKEKLESIGQKSINNIVDAANYIMFETGQPLHAFDYEKISGGKIIVRQAKKGEKIATLDNELIDLDDDFLIIADTKNPLALAGIKGGKRAEISKDTKTIVLESANFNLGTVRTASRKINLRTEASTRFEYGLDANLTGEAIDKVAVLIKEVAKGKIARGIIDIYPKKVYPIKINLDIKRVENILGKTISKTEITRILKLLDFDVDANLKVIVPTIRQDVKIQEDLIEEIARIIGYDNIEAKAPLGLLGITKLDDVLTITNKTKTILEGLGFTEVYNFSFIGEDDFKKARINKKGYIELENPLSVDLKYLRKDLIVNLLKNIRDNYKQVFGEENTIKIFELGKVYQQENNETIEMKMLAGAIVRTSEKVKGENFYELKGALDAILNKLGITDSWYDDFKATSELVDQIFWNKIGTAEIKIGDRKIGFIGEINPDILNAYNIKRKVAVFNLNFDQLLKMVSEELIYQPPSQYPAAVRDLAVLVNSGDRVGDVMKLIDDVGGELVQDVDLFDMYEGEGIPKDKKNLAFHIVYQSYEKTLKDEEVNKIQRNIIKKLEENNNWKVRK
ncbi:phenylalanine--tRNA ligase subunit beta [Patescibacteria group bacterium]|nr:phenylalanine--tRNA ligase subunit beta [Patescibacteria group bacterium]MBU4458526.1 phenylalanine--tRNA ligase subunit beta [Patescibacteria group bacterium]